MKAEAEALLADLARLGVRVEAHGGRLRLEAPAGVLDDTLKAEVIRRKPELLAVLAGPARSAAELLDQFLDDASIPAAVFHSKALDRAFVLARDPSALAALTDADRALPVIYFGDCAKGQVLGLEGLRVLLDLRERFGPEVALRAVHPARATT